MTIDVNTGYIETIKISKEFKSISGSIWLGMESTVMVNGNDDLIKEFIKRNELLEKSYMALNPHINWNESSQKENSEPIPLNEKAEGMKQLLKLCTTKQLLERQKGQVERMNNAELNEIYLTKLKSFE